MSSSIEFLDYVCEQGSQAGHLTYKKMFGEFGVYCDLKFFALVCDDQFFIKCTKEVMEKYPNLSLMPPYLGSKDYILVDFLDEREKVSKLIQETCEALPEKKPRKTK